MKRVNREKRDEQSLLREAMILKALKHPGIPIVYDLEQDEQYYYLIEEYLDGESLFALVSRQGGLSRAKTVFFGTELCQIIKYLHSSKPNPILHLDLQPKNLLVCDDALKLIDFDQAVLASLTGNLSKRYGTIGFAAPEQYSHAPLDNRTDIYAIGALLHFMGTGIYPEGERLPEEKLGKPLSDIIRQCIRPSKEERYADVTCVLEALIGLKAGVFAKNQISLLKIAVVSSSHGMGATHASLGLSSYLSEKGIKNLYTECSLPGIVRELADVMKLGADPYGIYHIRDLALRPAYGKCVKLEMPVYDAVIHDFGTDLDSVLNENYQLILLLCGGKWWERPAAKEALRRLSGTDNLRVIFNHMAADVRIVLPEEGKGVACFRMPYFSEPEKVDELMRAFWDEICSGTTIGQALAEDGRDDSIWEKRFGLREKLKRILKLRK